MDTCHKNKNGTNKFPEYLFVTTTTKQEKFLVLLTNINLCSIFIRRLIAFNVLEGEMFKDHATENKKKQKRRNSRERKKIKRARN